MLHPAIIPTCYTIEDFRRDAGIAILTYYGATAERCGVETPEVNCGEFWTLFPDGQSGTTSLVELSQTIDRAIRAVENYLGYGLCDKFICERVKYPTTLCGDMRQARGGNWKSVSVKDWQVKRYGRRSITSLGVFDVDYVDQDDDTFPETALIEVSPVAEQDICKLRMHFLDGKGASNYEVAPISTYQYDETTQTLTIDSCTLFFQDPTKSKQASKLGGCFVPCEMCCRDDDDDCEAPNCVVSQVEIWLEDVNEDCAAELIYNNHALPCEKCNACKTSKAAACLEEIGCNCARVIPKCATPTELLAEYTGVTVTLEDNTLTADATTAQAVYDALSSGLLVQVFDVVTCRKYWLHGKDICKLEEYTSGTDVVALQFQDYTVLCDGSTQDSLNAGITIDDATVRIYESCFSVASGCTCDDEPAYVDVHYITGCDKQCLDCGDCDGLTRFCPEFDNIIFMLTAAWLPRSMCFCGCNATDRIKQYQESAINEFGGIQGVLSEDYNTKGFFVNVSNPKRGEVQAWTMVKQLKRGCHLV